MMNKISLGLSISPFALILIMFVFGDINLNFNEDESVVVEQPKHDFCYPTHEYYDKSFADHFNKYPDEWKVFSCAEAYYIDYQIEYNIGLFISEHNNSKYNSGRAKHHEHRDGSNDHPIYGR